MIHWEWFNDFTSALTQLGMPKFSIAAVIYMNNDLNKSQISYSYHAKGQNGTGCAVLP